MDLQTLTASQILNSFGSLDYNVVLINFLVFVAGLLVNVYKTMQTQSITFTQYWISCGINSIASLTALIATFMSMNMLTTETPLYAFFLMAYTGDSLLNKALSPVVNERSVVDTKHALIETVVKNSKTLLLAVLFVVVVIVIL